MKIAMLTAAALLALSASPRSPRPQSTRPISRPRAKVPANDSKGSGTLTATYDTAEQRS